MRRPLYSPLISPMIMLRLLRPLYFPDTTCLLPFEIYLKVHQVLLFNQIYLRSMLSLLTDTLHRHARRCFSVTAGPKLCFTYWFPLLIRRFNPTVVSALVSVFVV